MAVGFVLFPFVLLLLALGCGLILAKLGWRGALVLVLVLLAGLGALLSMRLFAHASTQGIVSGGSGGTTYTMMQNGPLNQANAEKRANYEARAAAIRKRGEEIRKRAEETAATARARAEAATGSARVQVGPVQVEALLPGPLEHADVQVDEDPVVLSEETEAWRSAADLGFEADVYPSLAAAAESLIVQICKQKDTAQPVVNIQRAQVFGADPIAADVVSVVAARVQRLHGDWQVMTEALEPEQPLAQSDVEATTIHLDVPTWSTQHRAPWNPATEARSGNLRVRMTWKGGNIERTARFADKPWVENFSAFAASIPGPCIVGLSSSNAGSRSQARRQAIANAASQLLPQIRAEIQKVPSTSVDDRWLHAQIETVLSGSAKDRFSQTFIRPYGGQLFREAVLAEAEPIRQAVLHRCLGTLAGQRETWWATVVSAAGLLLFVCILGVILNAVTRGYYRGHVVVVGALVLIVGMLVVWNIAGAIQAARMGSVYTDPSALMTVQPDLDASNDAGQEVLY